MPRPGPRHGRKKPLSSEAMGRFAAFGRMGALSVLERWRDCDGSARRTIGVFLSDSDIFLSFRWAATARCSEGVATRKNPALWRVWDCQPHDHGAQIGDFESEYEALIRIPTHDHISLYISHHQRKRERPQDGLVADLAAPAATMGVSWRKDIFVPGRAFPVLPDHISIAIGMVAILLVADEEGTPYAQRAAFWVREILDACAGALSDMREYIRSLERLPRAYGAAVGLVAALSGAVPEGGGVGGHVRRCLIRVTRMAPFHDVRHMRGRHLHYPVTKKVPKFMMASVYRAIPEKPGPSGPAIPDRWCEIRSRPRELDAWSRALSSLWREHA